MNQRTNDQNGYYWHVVIQFIAFYKNWQPNVAHDWVKVTWDIESTAGLDTAEFEKLMNRVRVHTNKFWGMIIPLPNEHLTDAMAKNKTPMELFYYYNPTMA